MGILTRQVKRHKVKVTNRVMATRVLVREGRAIGAVVFDIRNGDLLFKLKPLVLFKRPVDPYIVEVDVVKEVYNVAVK